METAIGLICFTFLILAQFAAVVAVHNSQRQTGDERAARRRTPWNGARLPDAI
jgi:hypothetical protein